MLYGSCYHKNYFNPDSGPVEQKIWCFANKRGSLNRPAKRSGEMLANNRRKKFPAAVKTLMHVCRQWGSARYAFECARLRGTFSKNLVGIRRVESNRKRRLEVELRAPKCNDLLERANSRAAARTRVIIRACDIMCNKVYAHLRDDKTFPSVSRNRPT